MEKIERKKEKNYILNFKLEKRNQKKNNVNIY